MLSYNICLQTTTRIHVSTAAVSYYLPISCSSSDPEDRHRKPEGPLDLLMPESGDISFSISYVAR